MKYGPIVAERFKRQYFKRPKGQKFKAWSEFQNWQIQPEAIYTILLELKSKETIEALLNYGWTKRLPKTKVKK